MIVKYCWAGLERVRQLCASRSQTVPIRAAELDRARPTKNTTGFLTTLSSW